jgi:lipopolysaccharide transport system ATP-binding protein
MSDVSIQVRNLGKQYRIGRRQDGHRTLRDALVETAAQPFRLAARLLRGQKNDGGSTASDTIWALRDVNFDVHRGEAVGIIGYNGAGKSTLLKILSRVTDPTTGEVEIRGRVGSLLEVGTGFHPELSGRENVFLNGAILGMKRQEIIAKFDEIVAFAGIEQFIDTPVKHYSSGMYMRLAFSIAAHLEPEILVVDEVLAVGDISFQKKCLEKMKEVEKQGRTVLFVSHNMLAITRLCKRAILLEQGRIATEGAAEAVVHTYLRSSSSAKAERVWPAGAEAPGGEVVRLCSVRVTGESGEVASLVDVRRPVCVEMEYEVLKPGYCLMPHAGFTNDEGVFLFSTHDLDPVWRERPRPAGRYISRVRVPGNFLAPGSHFVYLGMNSFDPWATEFSVWDAVMFEVLDSLEDDSARGPFKGKMDGVIRPLLEWTTEVRSGQLEVKS